MNHRQDAVASQSGPAALYHAILGMNLPNKLTLLRVLLVPVYLLLLWHGASIPALVVFAAASLTDLLDGHIARSRGLVTNFGKFMDPIADKLLTHTAFIMLLAMGRLHVAACILFIAREFVVSGLRLVAASQGRVIAAGKSGKVKTVLQMALIMVLTCDLHVGSGLLSLTSLLTLAASVATLYSMIEYLWQNRAAYLEIADTDDAPQLAAGQALISRALHVATAESCTGGLVACRLVDVPGISASLGEAHVTYSNEAKMRYCGVREETLQKSGAVSEETAREMAEGLRSKSGADIAVATTGIAGPDGGTAEKPVGLVYIACASAYGTDIVRLTLDGSRQQIRSQAAKRALDMVRQAAGRYPERS